MSMFTLKNCFIRIVLFCLGLLVCLYSEAQTPDVNGTIYVNINAKSGSGSGDSWLNATTDLQAAINANGVHQVFVAVGNYEVSASNSFVMKEGVAIYGGFDPEKAILALTDNRVMPRSGLQGSVLNGKGERPVVWNYNNNLTATAVLDGFTLTAGKALNTTSSGGIYNKDVSPLLRNLLIISNTASNGAGMYNDGGSPQLFNVAIVNNVASDKGGGIYNNGAIPVLTNVTIAGNSASTAKAFYNATAGSVPVLNNSIVFGDISGNYSATYSLIENSLNTNDHNLNGSGVLPAHVFTNPQSGNYGLVTGSPAINQGSDNLFGSPSSAFDLAGYPRLSGSAIDLGAYEYHDLVASSTGIVYVRAFGMGNGGSWEDATGDLHAAVNVLNVQQVFVEKGTYPVSKSSFVLKKGIGVYGGFDPDHGVAVLSDTRILPDELTAGTVLNGRNERPVLWNVADGTSQMDSTAILDGFTLQDGIGTNGGGIYNENASPKLQNLVIKNNSSSNGGGIYNLTASPKIVNCRFFDNQTTLIDGSGGAICNSGSKPKLINCLFYDNSARNGGAICNLNNAYPSLLNCTIVSNHADGYGGAINSLDMSYPSLISCIVYGNTATLGNGGILKAATGADLIYNSMVQGLTGFDDNGNIQFSESIADLFTDPVASDYSLKTGSPVINMGRNNNIATAGVNTDLAGNNRIIGGSVDMGAFEADGCATTAILYVDGQLSLNSSGSINLAAATGSGASWATAYKTLGDALTQASSCPNVTEIRVAGGTYYPQGMEGVLNERTDAFTITRSNLKVLGGYNSATGQRDITANPTILKGYPASPSYHLLVLAEVPASDSLILDGFTINGGMADNDIDFEQIGAGTYIFHDVGAGVYLSTVGANVVLRNCIINGNKAATGAGIYAEFSYATFEHCIIEQNEVSADTYFPGYGAGLYATGSELSFKDCSFLNNNSEGNGAGLYMDASSFHMSGCSIIGNEAGGDGGGVFSSFGSMDLLNCIFQDNSATGNGGGFYNSGTNPAFTNVTFIQNQADGSGGGIYNETGVPVLTNATIAGNTASEASAFYTTLGSMPEVNNSIIYGGITGNYESKYSLREGIAGGSNGNLDGTKYSLTEVFNSPATGDFSLLDASPAINKGSNQLFVGLNLDTKDVVGNSRVYKGLIIDMGAYEYQGEPVALPVSLISFIAIAQNNQARLSWQTGSELFCERFDIFRSTDGVQFTKIGSLPSKGNFSNGANYDFYDINPVSGHNYYQLIEVDQDGSSKNIGVKDVVFKEDAPLVKIYPNPVKNIVRVEFGRSKYSLLELLDLNGRRLKVLSVNVSDTIKEIDLTDLPNGIYLIRLSGKGAIMAKKVIKN